MDPILVSLIAFVAVTSLVAAVFFMFRDMGNKKTEDRLMVMAGLKTADQKTGADAREAIVRESLDGIAGAFNKFLGRLGNLGQFFEQADCPINPNLVFLMAGGFGLLLAAAGTIARTPIPLIPIFFLMGTSIPFIWLMWRRGKRFNQFSRQMPDALELIGRALRSGHGLASALHVVVEEMPSPISTEFGIVYEEQNLGIPIEQALKNMLRRMPNLDLKFFVTAVAIQRQAGGDLSEILDKIGYIIRERFKIMGQVQALTGEGRISGIVLMALPIVLFFVVYHINPDYVMLLFEDPVGRKMLVGGIVLQILGAITIKKIISIKI